MNKSELQSSLNQKINDFDHASLQKVMNYVLTLNDKDGYVPSINKESLAIEIKGDLRIIVPVVCDDMFEYIKDGKSMSVGDYLIDWYFTERQVPERIVKAIKSDLYYGLSLYEKEENKGYSNSIYESIKKGINDGRIKLRDSVVEFLTKGYFPVIVTTFGFDVIEKAIGGHYEPVYYNPTKRNDLPFIVDKDTRVVYHIFGGETHTSWAYNEQTLLNYVHALHSGDYGAKNLANYLRGTGVECVKRPLVLGSTLPNWLFRFFLYPLYDDKLSDSSGYWLSLDDIDSSLDLFLSHNNYTGQTNLRKNNQVDNILSESAVDNTILEGYDNVEEKKPYRLFVSYKRELKGSTNEKTIERIVELLKKQAKASRGDVWLDVKEVSEGGNPYWANIKKAVQDCNLFVPIVSKHYLEEYRDAPDIEKLANEKKDKGDFKDAEPDRRNANDDEPIQNLKPVVREAYYAIAYHKNPSPIVIKNQEGKLNGGTMEKIIKNYKNSKDKRNLPSYIFNETNALEYDDNNPDFFKLPQIV